VSFSSGLEPKLAVPASHPGENDREEPKSPGARTPEDGALGDASEHNRTVEAASVFGSVLVQNHQSWSLDRGHEDAAFPLGCRGFGRGEHQPGAAR